MDSEKIIGCICGIVGLFGIGYAIGASSKLKSVSDAVNKSVDSIIADGKVDIPKEMINETIQNNVKEMVETIIIQKAIKFSPQYRFHISACNGQQSI